jgi:hypothetical protein
MGKYLNWKPRSLSVEAAVQLAFGEFEVERADA